MISHGTVLMYSYIPHITGCVYLLYIYVTDEETGEQFKHKDGNIKDNKVRHLHMYILTTLQTLKGFKMKGHLPNFSIPVIQLIINPCHKLFELFKLMI